MGRRRRMYAAQVAPDLALPPDWGQKGRLAPSHERAAREIDNELGPVVSSLQAASDGKAGLSLAVVVACRAFGEQGVCRRNGDRGSDASGSVYLQTGERVV